MLKPDRGTILLVVSVLAFYRLGSGEIRSWDEGLYLMRALSCLRYHDWFDQTSHALGGLYSSSHPPFGIWLFSIARWLSSSEAIVRLPSALAYVASSLYLFELLRLDRSRRAVLIGTLSFTCAQTYIYYAHSAQLDSILVAAMTASAYYYRLAIDASSRREAICSGIALGLALLTKFGFGLFLLPYFLILTPRKHFGTLAIAVATSFVLAAPWYIWMSVAHPTFGLHAFRVAASAGYEATTHAHWYYYLNQLLVNVPLLALGVGALRQAKRVPYRPLIAAGVWLAVTLGALMLASTTMPHYTLLLLLPSSILVAYAIELFPVGRIAIIATAIALLWSASEQIRLLLRGALSFPEWHAPSMLAMVVSGLLVASGIWIAVRRRDPLAVCAAVLIAFSVGRLVNRSPNAELDGAAQVAALIERVKPSQIAIRTNPAPFCTLAPQLAYYTNGITANWDRAVRVDAASWSAPQPALRPAMLIVERHIEPHAGIASADSVALARTEEYGRLQYVTAFHTRSYSVYFDTLVH